MLTLRKHSHCCVLVAYRQHFVVSGFTRSPGLFEAGRCLHVSHFSASSLLCRTTCHFEAIRQVQGPRSWDDLLDSLTDAFFERVEEDPGEL